MSTANKPILYYLAGSNHGRVAQAYAAAIGADIDLKVVDMMKGEHKSADFLKINPAGQVPALVDGDLHLAESASIMRYLAHKFPSKLYPLDDIKALGRIDYANEYIRQKTWQAVGDLVFQTKWAPMMTGKPTAPELLATLREKLVVSLDRLASTWFQEHPDHVVGTETSMADVTLAVMLNHLLTGTDYDIAAHPKVQHFRKAAQKNPLLKLD